DDVHQAFALAESLARDRGMLFTHPFDDPAVIAGHGTTGLELAEQAVDLEVVVVPVGGGGLIAGVAAAMKRLQPDLRIFGVEPHGAAAMSESLRIGRPARLERVGSVADGLAPPMAGEITYRHVRALVDDVVRVSDAEITSAVRALAETAKMVVEPAGAAGVAALLCGRIPDLGAGPAGAIVSGGNVDASLLAEILAPERAGGAAPP
ncbi:MAG: pyridoxal-phosphate dependent enzyme, partial [Gammaproteobacteria bacterium]|nr:pyridoxal-phosphate dependent enzyme [Gammaproteobacteria bacterium]